MLTARDYENIQRMIDATIAYEFPDGVQDRVDDIEAVLDDLRSDVNDLTDTVESLEG